MKLKMEPKKYFWISINTFACDVFFFINYSHTEIVKELKNKKKYKQLVEYLNEYTDDESDSVMGRMLPLKRGYAVRLCFPAKSHRKNISLLSHEVSHLVSWILMDRRINLTKDNDEVFAYLTEEIMYKFLTKWY